MPTDRLLDAIYSAAFDIDGWQSVCDQVAEHADAVGSVLICSRPELRPFNMCRSDSIGELMDEYVREAWYLRDARSIGVQKAGLSGSFFCNGYVLDSQLMSPEQMEREPFYADLLARHGLKWFCGLRIGDNGDWAALSVNRGLDQDDFGSEYISTLLRYARHMTRAAKVAEIASFTRLDAALQSFEATATPAFAIDALGLVLRHNAAAEGMLGHGLSVSGRRLVCDLIEDQPALDRLVSQLARFTPAGDLKDPVVIRQRDGIPTCLARGCPLRGPPVDIFAGPTSILFVQPLQRTPKPVARLLQEAFGLSPKQAQLAELLSVGQTLRQAAEQLGITYTTARDHLKIVFLRTGTHRQAELVALVGRLMQ
jgi:DNA-binding CsgD family transcriptional regulator